MSLADNGAIFKLASNLLGVSVIYANPSTAASRVAPSINHFPSQRVKKSSNKSISSSERNCFSDTLKSFF